MCPDRHLRYTGRTPEQSGVGGGVTARIRMAEALARAGCQVSMVVNCGREEWHKGVHYIPLGEARGLRVDVCIVNSSGGAYSLEGLESEGVESGLRIYWMSGVDSPAGFDAGRFDYVYAKSNFLRKQALENWGVPCSKVFVAYNGFEEAYFRDVDAEESRDPYQLVYFSHPSKGLDAALRVLRILREQNERFHLEVFGGAALWGQHEERKVDEPGMVFHGLVGQRELARHLVRASYSICLQEREEPFGMVLTESQRAGCVVLASPVGAFPELIRHGVDGFLVEGPGCSEEAARTAAEIILEIDADHTRRDSIRRKARSVPWSSDMMARVWLQHWAYVVSDSKFDWKVTRCANCSGTTISLVDGQHCFRCGWFERY